MKTLTALFDKTKIPLIVIFNLIYFFIITISGGSIFEFLVFLLSIISFVLLPGFILHEILGIKKYISGFDYPIIATLGMGFLTATYAVVIRLNLDFLFYILFPVFVVIAFILIRKSPILKTLKAIDKQQFLFLIFIVSALIFVYSFSGVAKFAHPNVVGRINLSQDFMWNVGNAESFKLGFPPEDLRFSDVRLQYHYFTELFVSAISFITGISSYNILGFYSQSFFLFNLVFTLYLTGKKLLKTRLKANLFAISIFSLSCLSLHKILPNGWSVFWNTFISAIISNINSMCNALFFLCVFIVLMNNMQEKKYKVSCFYFFAMFGSFVLLIFSKSPISAIIAIALVATLIARFIQRKFITKEIVFVLFFSLSFLAIYVLNFSSGANVSTGFSLDYTLKLGYFSNIIHRIKIEIPAFYTASLFVIMFIQMLCSAPFTMPLFFIRAFKSLLKFKEIDFLHLFAFAIGFGGFTAFFISYHEALSQVYFLYVAIFFITFIAIESFEFVKPNTKNIFFYTMLCLSLTTSAFLYIHLLGSGLRQVLFNEDILQKYNYKYTVTADDENAGEFLRNVHENGNLFLTNRVHTGAGEGLSNVYTCFSGMQSYMEGYKYTVSNMGLDINIAMDRYNYHLTVFDATSSFDYLVKSLNEREIDYIVYSTQFEGSVSQLENFEKVFTSPTVTIYEVPEI